MSGQGLLLLWVLALVGLFGGLLLLATREAPRSSATLMALSYLLIAPVGLAPQFGLPLAGQLLSQATINNSLFLASAAVGIAAIRALGGRRAWPPLLLASVLVALLANAWLATWSSESTARLAVFNLLLSGFRLAAVLELLRLYRLEAPRYALIWAVVLAIEVLVGLLRAQAAAAGWLYSFGPVPQDLVSWTWIPTLGAAMLHAPLFVLTQLQRDAAEQRRIVEHLQTQLPVLPDVLLETDPRERIVAVRGPGVALGWSKLPAPGTALAAVCTGPVLAALRQGLNGQAPGSVQSYPLLIDGQHRRFEVTAAGPRELGQRASVRAVLVRDVTERRRLEEALRFRNRLFDHFFQRAPIGLLLSRLDDNTVIDFNPALARLLGDATPIREGTALASLVDRIDHPLLVQMRSELVAEERSGPHEVRLHRGAHGPTVRVHAILIRDDSGQALSWALVEDVSEQRRVEQMQSAFLGMVSHELRTPLASVIGALDLIDHPAVRELPAKSNQLLAIARESVEKLRTQVEDLLDLNHLLDPRTPLQLQTQPVGPVLGAALERVRMRAQQRRVRIDIVDTTRDADADIDRERLIRALVQLLHNAIRHSPEDGEVQLQLEDHPPRALRLSVIDQGPGVPAALQPVLFEKFSQGTGGSTRLPGGSGLGLAIVRETALRHHGDAGHRPGPAGGACFYIDLPRRPRDAVGAPGAD